MEGTIKVAHQGEGTTSLRVGLLGEHLVDGPHDGRIGRADEAVLQRGGREYHVKVLDQGKNLQLGVDGGEAGIPMGNGMRA